MNCCICHQKYKEDHLLQSDMDEYYCKECFKHQYCTATKKKRKTRKNLGGDPPLRTNKMFTPLDLVLLEKQRRLVEDGLSKRPLQCPHPSCNRYVSIFDLFAHFQHEHTKVHMDNAKLDERRNAKVQTNSLRYCIRTCILLLNVELPPPLFLDEIDRDRTGKNDKIELLFPRQLERPFPMVNQIAPLTVAVLASRIPGNTSISPTSEQEMHHHHHDSEEDNLSACPDDRVIVWLASNINTQYSYTVAASTLRGDIRVKYYGPMPQLSCTPMQVYKEGMGLILNNFQYLGMTENGLKPLNLDVIIHSDD